MMLGNALHAASCYLDEKSFQQCCQRFIQHSTTIRDGWSWVQVKGDEEGYMRKTLLIPGRSSSLPGLHQTGDDVDHVLQEEQMDEESDVVPTPSDDAQVVMQYDYHVLYSCSYQVPILYFRASTLEGRPLSLEEVWSNVHPNYMQRLQQGPWETLTQQEHPILGQPFFMLHPCRTEEFMRPVLQMAHAEGGSVNYVVSWLSVVGPAVGLTVPLSYSAALIAPD